MYCSLHYEHVIICSKDNRVTQGGLTLILHRMEVMLMDLDFKDLIAFGVFILALLSYIDRNRDKDK